QTMFVKDPQAPDVIAISWSKLAVDTMVMSPPVPVKVYHTPLFPMEHPASSSVPVEPAVVPFRVSPQAMVAAVAQVVLSGGHASWVNAELVTVQAILSS